MIVTTDEGKFKVYLNEREALKYNIALVLRESNSQTAHQVLTKIFKSIIKDSYGYIYGKTLAIELFPQSDGGCIIFFEPNMKIKPKTQKNKTIVIYFYDSNDLFSFAEEIASNGITFSKDSLYLKDGKFVLLIAGATAKIKMILNQYTVKISTLIYEENILKEHGKFICEDAISKIANAIKEK